MSRRRHFLDERFEVIITSSKVKRASSRRIEMPTQFSCSIFIHSINNLVPCIHSAHRAKGRQRQNMRRQQESSQFGVTPCDAVPHTFERISRNWRRYHLNPFCPTTHPLATHDDSTVLEAIVYNTAVKKSTAIVALYEYVQ